MNAPNTAMSQRFSVRSSDGTEIAVWVEGRGQPLVLVHGSLQDHSISAALVAELRSGMTCYCLDRRGFGASGNTPGYAIEREFEDVASVVDAVAARTNGPVALWGHSFGASVAMGAAARASAINRLVLYEPSLGLVYPEGWIDELETTLGRGDLETAIVMVLHDVLEFDEQQIEAMRSGPEWARRVAVAPTVAREARAEQEWVYRPGQFCGITARTLLLSGSESTPPIKRATNAAASAIAGARVHVLDGHGHVAHRTDPAMVAELLRGFVAG